MKGVGGKGLIGDDAGGATNAGPSAGRPVLASTQSGFYFDQTLGKMLYWGGAHWFDLTGAQVADYVPAVAPTNTVLPAITGTAQVGQTLTASTGTWSGSPTSYAYQWLRSGVTIAGATSATYAEGSADLGATLACVVTASNTAGSASATSAATGVVSGAAPVLATLTLSPATAKAGTPYGGTVSGQTSGSTIAATSSDGTSLTVSGATVSGTFNTAGSKTITLTETLSGATGSPKASTATVTVSPATADSNVTADTTNLTADQG